VPILFPLSDRQLWQLARLLVPKSFAKGQMVFHQGDEADNFYICQRGAFSCFTSECYTGAPVSMHQQKLFQTGSCVLERHGHRSLQCSGVGLRLA
jgi:hypothetical protein